MKMKKDLQWWLTVLLKIVEVPVIVVLIFVVMALIAGFFYWIIHFTKLGDYLAIISLLVILLFFGYTVWNVFWEDNYNFVGKMLKKFKNI